MRAEKYMFVSRKQGTMNNGMRKKQGKEAGVLAMHHCFLPVHIYMRSMWKVLNSMSWNSAVRGNEYESASL